MSNRLEFPRPAKPPRAGPAPLSSVPASDRVWQVLAVRCSPEEARILAREGVEPGSRVQVLHQGGQGVVALRVRCRILVLGRRFPLHVEVAPLPAFFRTPGRLITFGPVPP